MMRLSRMAIRFSHERFARATDVAWTQRPAINDLPGLAALEELDQIALLT